jgi:uncharacterized membrane protein YadS
MIVNTYIHAVASISHYLVAAAKAGLTLTLFLIGAGLSRQVLAAVGLKPMIQAIVLWIAISGSALYAVMHLA